MEIIDLLDVTLLFFQIEMQTMLGMGVPPSKIVYANPCKQASHIRLVCRLGLSILMISEICLLLLEPQLFNTDQFCVNSCLSTGVPFVLGSQQNMEFL